MSGEGFGQPQIPTVAEINVTNLRVIETPAFIFGDVMNIIDNGEPFQLELTFEVKHFATEPMKGAGDRARVVFHAEEVGAGEAALDLGTACVDLEPDVKSYSAILNHPGLDTDAIYRIGAMLTFEEVAPGSETDCNAAVVTTHDGFLGFYEGLLLQVHKAEQ